MKCENCNSEVQRDATKCPICGNKLDYVPELGFCVPKAKKRKRRISKYWIGLMVIVGILLILYFVAKPLLREIIENLFTSIEHKEYWPVP